MQFTYSFLRVFWADIIHAGPLLIFILVTIGVIGLIIGRIERWTPLDALYHAFINATTVGYGDFRPTRTVPKILSTLLALVGLIFTGLVVAIAVHAAQAAFVEVYGAGKLFGQIAE